MWYYALPGTALRPGRMVARQFLGEPLVFARAADGTAYALRDLCPHRGIPLSEGRCRGDSIECRFHGWRFDTAGRCAAIPSLTDADTLDPGRIRVKSYPVTERQGNIWVFFGDDPASAPAIPELPEIGERQQPNLTLNVYLPCPIDDAVFGFMDPSHNPFVHTSWWWRRRGSIRTKEKAFGPSPYGFTMLRHRPSGNLTPYKLLGGAPETEIVFRLPASRIEHTRFGRHWFTTITSATPLGEADCQLAHAAYWSAPVLSAIKPLLRWGGATFIGQDRDILVLQSRGARYNPTKMLIDDADTQARWYYRLKQEYLRSRAEGRPFVNPVSPRVLRFRS
jgi:phenylpropionate dioxygenase-like ring-hydroxylating dioxygenase large terminal subunit